MTSPLRLVKNGRPVQLTDEQLRELIDTQLQRDVADRVKARVTRNEAERKRHEADQAGWRVEGARKIRRRKRLEYAAAVLILLASLGFTAAGTYWAALASTACLIAWSAYLAYETGPGEGE